MANNPEKKYLLYRILLFFPLLLVLSGAVLFPFYYETTTLWYKFGIDKIYLRAGQIAGALAFCLILLQIILGVRGAFLEKVYGAANLLRLHRCNGIVIVLLALTHILLILIPEGLDNLPIGEKHWPEMTGGGIFVLLLVTVIISYLRAGLRLNYKIWRRFHGIVGFLLVLGAGIHIYFVSDSFEQLIPQIILLTLIGVVTGWVVIVKLIAKRN